MDSEGSVEAAEHAENSLEAIAIAKTPSNASVRLHNLFTLATRGLWLRKFECSSLKGRYNQWNECVLHGQRELDRDKTARICDYDSSELLAV